MVRRKYPLEPLAVLRQSEVERARRELAESVERRREAAARARERASDAAGHAAKVSETKRDENARLQAGELRVSDLEQASLWADEARRVQGHLDHLSQQADMCMQDAHSREADAQQALAAADARLEVIEKNRAKHDEAQARELEEREEEAMDEAHRPARRP